MVAKDVLLERDRELGLIDAAVRAVHSGRGSLLLIEGPAGIGKTRLLDAAGELAAARSARVLRGRGGELEHDFAYGVVRQLFERLLAGAGRRELARLLTGPAGVAAERLHLLPSVDQHAEPASPGDDPGAAVVHGLYWLAANLASAQPLTLILDDLHWVDVASLRFVAYLARRLDSAPVLVVAAARPVYRPDSVAPVLAVKQETGTTLVRLSPLSADAAKTLIRDEFDRRADEAFCAACHTVTGGNPFLLRELLQALREEGVMPDVNAVDRVARLVPAALTETIMVRLGRLPPAAVKVARAVAVLGTAVAPRHAWVLAGLPGGTGASACDLLASAGILGRDRPLDFVHPLVRAAVHESIPPAERRDLHRRAGRLLAAEGTDAQRIAPHLLACEAGADPWVVTTLRRAAGDAVGHGAAETAVRYLRRALDEPPEPALRPAVLAELGKAEVRAGEPDAAVAHLREALGSTDDPRARAAMAHDLAIGLIAPGRYREAVQMLAEAARAVGETDTELGMRLDAELICAARLDPATLPIASTVAGQAPLTLPGRTPGERMLLATLAHARMISGASAAEVRDLAGRAVDGGLLDEQPADSGVVIDVLVALTVADDFDRATRAFERAFADVRQRGSVIGYARLCCMRSLLEYRLGALADAESDAASAIETGMPAGYRVAAMAHGPLLDALVAQGRFDEAEDALVAGGLGAEIADTYMLNYALGARGRLRLAAGRVATALADLQDLDRRERKWRAGNPGVLGYGFDLALAHAAAGDSERAAAVAARELTAARAWGAPSTVGAALRTSGLVLGGDAGIDLLAESVAVLDGSPARLELARSLIELGSATRRAGHRSTAREPLARGMELAHLSGATALVARARDEALAAGSRPRRIMRTGIDALTASERRVARMAAQGMTNREIAQALFVTVRTVQVHLQHAYRKLGIDSRRQLRTAAQDL